jgi:hypothetical protein
MITMITDPAPGLGSESPAGRAVPGCRAAVSATRSRARAGPRRRRPTQAPARGHNRRTAREPALVWHCTEIISVAQPVARAATVAVTAAAAAAAEPWQLSG